MEEHWLEKYYAAKSLEAKAVYLDKYLECYFRDKTRFKK
jgi:hypothetical protein